MKKILTVIIFLAVTFVGLGLAKNIIVKGVAQKAVYVATGLKLKIASLNIGILNTSIGIKEMRLMNPKGFSDPIMLDMPEILVDYNLKDILGGNIHLEDVRLALKEVVIIKQADGTMNIDTIKAVGSKGEAGKKSDGKSSGESKPEVLKEKKPMTIAIDHLYLQIGRVVYKDYSVGTNPKVMNFDLNIKEEYTNITNVNSLIGIIMLKVMTKTTLGALTNFDANRLMSNLNLEGIDLSTLGLGAISSQATEVANQAQGLLNSLKGAVGDVSKDSGEGLSSLFKSASENLQKTLKETK